MGCPAMATVRPALELPHRATSYATSAARRGGGQQLRATVRVAAAKDDRETGPPPRDSEELIADARAATRAGEKMSKEQYSALKRKIGGTAKNYFKEFIDVAGDYVEEGWVDKRCRYCGKDTSREPRQKDSSGRYAHVACAEAAPKGNFFSRLFGR
eukprot:SM000111S18823  [mRNA]  locus=s111:334748:335543:- [translate_table: standard]